MIRPFLAGAVCLFASACASAPDALTAQQEAAEAATITALLQAAPVPSGVAGAIEEIRARDAAIEDQLAHVEEGLEDAETDRVEMMKLLLEMRGETQSLKAMLAARGS